VQDLDQAEWAIWLSSGCVRIGAKIHRALAEPWRGEKAEPVNLTRRTEVTDRVVLVIICLGMGLLRALGRAVATLISCACRLRSGQFPGKIGMFCLPSRVSGSDWGLMKLFGGATFVRRRRSKVFLLTLSLLLAGCNSQSPPRKPSLQITQVPSADPGGPAQLDYIEGRAIGAQPGQQIVLYAHSGVWWIQPFTNQSFTKIQADSTWKNSTHLGTEYAALLVEPGYRPPAKAAVLPTEGNGVVAVVIAPGKPAAPIISKVIRFSGYDWTVRSAGSDRGGEPNAYDPGNAWVDQKGYLHLRMEQRDGHWSCAEVSLTRSLGFGSYKFVVQDSSHLGPSAVVGMFTWDEAGTDENRNELDIELSRWGHPDGKNAQYVVQPFYVPENVARFTAPPGVLTHMFRWEPGKVSFKSVRGSVVGPGSKPVSEHVFTSGVPGAASEAVHIDLYEYHHSKSSSQQPAEVVIEKFEYLP